MQTLHRFIALARIPQDLRETHILRINIGFFFEHPGEQNSRRLIVALLHQQIGIGRGDRNRFRHLLMQIRQQVGRLERHPRRLDLEGAELAALRAKAEQGNGVAQYNLGLAYADAQQPYADRVEAFVWLSLAAERGSTGKALKNPEGDQRGEVAAEGAADRRQGEHEDRCHEQPA